MLWIFNIVGKYLRLKAKVLGALKLEVYKIIKIMDYAFNHQIISEL